MLLLLLLLLLKQQSLLLLLLLLLLLQQPLLLLLLLLLQLLLTELLKWIDLDRGEHAAVGRHQNVLSVHQSEERESTGQIHEHTYFATIGEYPQPGSS